MLISTQSAFFLIVCSLAVLLGSCTQSAPLMETAQPMQRRAPPAGVPCAVAYVAGTQTMVGEGFADDGDDVRTAPAGPVRYPPAPAAPAPAPPPIPLPAAAASATDGPANASSSAVAFNNLGVNKVTARKRQTAGGRLPKSMARTIGASNFTVAPPVPITCQFQIDSNAIVTVMGGTTGYKVRAEITTAAGGPVTGAAYAVEYEFRQGLTGIDIFSEASPGAPVKFLRVLTDPLGVPVNPGTFSTALAPDLGPPGGFTLAPGTYTVTYTLEAEGVAERQTVPPSVVVDIDADAQFDIVTFP